MRKIIYFLVVTLLLVSCDLKDIDFDGVESYKLDKFENNIAHISLKLKVNNENWFNLKVKPSKLIVSADGKELGTLLLDKKVKIKGKTSKAYDAFIRFKLSDGALFSFMGLAGRSSVNLNFKGKVKGGVFIFSKKIKIDQSKTINPSELNLNMFK